MTGAHVRLAIVALVGLAAGAVTALAVLPQARERLLPAPGFRTWGEALIGGPFALVDHTGRRVTDADFRGRIMLVLFGSSASPDVTPAALQVLAAALDKLGPRADRFAPILVTVDPARDSPERLQSYLRRFSPRLIGLTGTAADIEHMLQAYRTRAVASDENGASAPVTTDPPGLIYVMGEDGRYRTHLNAAVGADAVAASLAKLL